MNDYQYNPDQGVHVSFNETVNYYATQTSIAKLLVKGVGFLKNGFNPKQFFSAGGTVVRTKVNTVVIHEDGRVEVHPPNFR